MKRIILSGFGTFGNYRHNLSQTVAEWLDGDSIYGYKIKSIVFPADVSCGNKGEILFDLAKRTKSVGIISLGIASEKRGLCVETRARNLFDNAKYCSAELNGKPIDSTRKVGEELKLDLTPWNIPTFCHLCRCMNLVTEISENCGGWCCNELAYHARCAQLAVQSKIIPAFIFIHTPCAYGDIVDYDAFERQNKVTMDLETVIAGITDLLVSAKF